MHDPIFGSLKPVELAQICKLMSFDPVLSEVPFRTLSKVSEKESLAWLQANSSTVEREICRLGSWSFGDVRDYGEIVRDLAKKMGAASDGGRLEQVERSLIVKVWNDAVAKFTPSQVEELKNRAQQIAETYGKSLGGEVTGFAALTAAQMSGFGVYMLGSTVLGAINGALGLSLSFGAFTGLSSLIATVTGPIGWTALGLFAVLKLGAPNYKKILPVVIFVASQRSLIEGSGVEKRELVHQSASLRLPARSQAPEISNVRKAPASQPRSLVPALNSNSVILEFKAEVLRATKAAKTHRQVRPVSLPARRVASKLEKHIFDLVPDNKLLRDVARESVEEHFLDLSEADQADIRGMVRERQLIQQATAIQKMQEAHIAAMGEKQKLRDSRRRVPPKQAEDPRLTRLSELVRQQGRPLPIIFVRNRKMHCDYNDLLREHFSDSNDRIGRVFRVLEEEFDGNLVHRVMARTQKNSLVLWPKDHLKKSNNLKLKFRVISDATPSRTLKKLLDELFSESGDSSRGQEVL